MSFKLINHINIKNISWALILFIIARWYSKRFRRPSQKGTQIYSIHHLWVYVASVLRLGNVAPLLLSQFFSTPPPRHCLHLLPGEATLLALVQGLATWAAASHQVNRDLCYESEILEDWRSPQRLTSKLSFPPCHQITRELCKLGRMIRPKTETHPLSVQQAQQAPTLSLHRTVSGITKWFKPGSNALRKKQGDECVKQSPGEDRKSPQDIQDQTFIPALLRYSWHKILFKVYMIWYTLTPPSPHLITLFFCCKIILRSTHRAIFMDIIQYHYYSHHVLDIRFPELTHLIAGSQYPLPSTSPYISSKLHPWQWPIYSVYMRLAFLNYT